MFGLGMSELLVIFMILLLLFGASRLPGIAAGLGGAVHTFRKSLKGDDNDARQLEGSAGGEKVEADKSTSKSA